MSACAYFQGEFVPLEDARISVMTHAFNYGTACFEGIRGNWNAAKEQLFIFKPDDHFERLIQSARVLNIAVSQKPSELTAITHKLVEMCGFREDIYIRPMAYKSSLEIGVRLHNLEDDLLVFVTPFGNYLDVDAGIHCCVSSWRRIDDSAIPPRAKITGLYVNSALAKTEAIENGFDEGILLNNGGSVSEGSGENIFLVEGGKLITPPPGDNILVGITRNTIIQLAADEFGIETEERSISRGELYAADECFLTGTAAHVSPVLSIDRRLIGAGVGPITKRLSGLYFNIIRGNVEKYAGWCLAAYGDAVPARP